MIARVVSTRLESDIQRYTVNHADDAKEAIMVIDNLIYNFVILVNVALTILPFISETVECY